MRVFMDANCLFSAIVSPSGGSGKILKMAQQKMLRLVLTRSVIQEAERNLRERKGDFAVMKLSVALTYADREIIADPSTDDESRWHEITAEKDRHILAGACKGNADVLISLDKHHILTEKVKQGFPISVMKPGEFLQRHL